MMLVWKRDKKSGVVHASLGNNLYIVIQPVTVWVMFKRPRTGGKNRQFYDPAIVAGNPWEHVTVRRWGGGGNGHGQYPTLKAAKKGAIDDALCVGQACLRQLGALP